MSCPGLHCPGCSSGQSAGIAAQAVIGLVVLDQTVTVVAENILPITAVVVACFVLSVIASMWLESRTDRRCAEWGRKRGIYSRADYIAPPRRPAAELPRQQRNALPAPQVVNIFNFGADATNAAAIIRQALPATAGDAITKEE